MAARDGKHDPLVPGLVVHPLFVTCANTGIYRPTGLSWFSCGMSGKAVFAVLTLT